MKYRVTLNRETPYYFKSLNGVNKFIKLIFKFTQLFKEETEDYDERVEIRVDNFGI